MGFALILQVAACGTRAGRHNFFFSLTTVAKCIHKYLVKYLPELIGVCLLRKYSIQENR